jgi:hypothetical protein
MIGHPSNSGLQSDQVTLLYIPAFFVNELRLWQDDRLVLAMEGGISISEDPIFDLPVSRMVRNASEPRPGTQRPHIPERMENRRLGHLKRRDMAWMAIPSGMSFRAWQVSMLFDTSRVSTTTISSTSKPS